MASLDPMMLGSAVSSSARFSRKALAFLCLFMGAGCIVLWSSGYGQQVAVAQDSITMAWRSARLGGPSQLMQPGRAQQSKDLLSRYGIGSSPVERVAIAAIEASSLGNCRRDVSMKAMEAAIEKSKEEDPQFGEKLAQVTKAVENKAVPLESLKLEEWPGAGISGPWSFFDPLELSTVVGKDTLLFYREAELKHGRVCMLATLGIVVAEKYHPLFGGALAGPSLFAFQKTPVEYQSFWWAIFVLIGIPEILTANFPFLNKPWTIKEGKETGTWGDGREPGDLGFDPLGLKKGFEETGKFKELQAKELNNGRLAMIAAAGMFAQEMVTGKTLF